jgi:hypothetical protein
MEVALMRGKVLRLGAVGQAIADADGDLREVREHVELREREPVDAVHANRVAKGDEVEPAAAAAASGDDAVLVSELAHPLLVRSFDLRRERPLTDHAVTYALATPITRSILFGPMPTPAAAFAATVLDDVTNGYVPWSTSSSVPWPPSSSTDCPP